MNYFSNRYILKGDYLKRADNLETSFKQEKIDARLLKSMLMAICDSPKVISPSELYYYVYYIDDNPRFVFVTRHLINIAQLESKWGERDESFNVEGALFDIVKGQFVEFPKDAKPLYGCFYHYCIHDSGVPNHIVSGDKSYVFYLEANGFYKYAFESVEKVSQIVVHLTEARGVISRKRVYFFKSYTSPECLQDVMLILEHDIYLNRREENVKFGECLYDGFTRKGELAMIHFFGLGSYNHFDKSKEKVLSKSATKVYIIGGSCCVVVRDYRAEFGEFVFLLLSNDIQYDYYFSCFNYELVNIPKSGFVGHLVVKVHYAVDDFQNKTEIYDITDRKIYHEDEFKQLSEDN